MPKASKFIEDEAKDGRDDNGEDGQHDDGVETAAKVNDARGRKRNNDYDIAAGEDRDVTFHPHDDPIDHHVDNDCFMDIGACVPQDCIFFAALATASLCLFVSDLAI